MEPLRGYDAWLERPYAEDNREDAEEPPEPLLCLGCQGEVEDPRKDLCLMCEDEAKRGDAADLANDNERNERDE